MIITIDQKLIDRKASAIKTTIVDVTTKPIIVNRRPKRRYRSKSQTTIKTIDDKRKHKRNESNVTVIRQPTAYITINKNSTAEKQASSSNKNENVTVTTVIVDRQTISQIVP